MMFGSADAAELRKVTTPHSKMANATMGQQQRAVAGE
jgi:hypothetical protein